MLPDHIIKPHQLHNALNSVKKSLSIKYPSFQPVHNELAFYYNTHLSAYTLTEKCIYIQLQVPISDIIPVYNIYTVHLLPVPVSTLTNPHTGHTYITNIDDLFIPHISHTHYLQLTKQEFDLCDKDKLIQCPFQIPHKSKERFSCTSALFYDNEHAIKQHCNFTFTSHKPHDPLVTHVSNNQFLTIPNEFTPRISCTDRSVSTIKDCRICFISLPCHCTLQVGPLSIHTPLQTCDNSLSTTIVKHGMNLAFTTHYDIYSPSLHSHSLSDTYMNIDMPDIMDSIQNFTDLTELQKQKGLDLKQLAKSIKEQQKTFESINYTMEDNIIKALPFSDSNLFKAICPTITLIFMVIVTFVVIFLVLKHRKLALIVATLQAVPKASAYIILQPNYSKTTTTPNPDTDIDPFTQYYSIMTTLSVAFCFFATIRFFYFIGDVCSRCPNVLQYFNTVYGPAQNLYNCQLFIKLYNGNKRALLLLHSIPHEPNMVSFALAPKIQTSFIKYRNCIPYLSVTWANKFHYFVGDVQHSFSLPRYIYIPFPLRRLVKDITNSPDHHCTIVTRYRDELIEIPFTSNNPEHPIIFQMLPLNQKQPHPCLTLPKCPEPPRYSPASAPQASTVSIPHTGDGLERVSPQSQTKPPTTVVTVHSPTLNAYYNPGSPPSSRPYQI